MARIQSDWSGICEDLLLDIVKFIPARIDILRLRAVCRSFRAIIRFPSINYPFPDSILTNADFLKGPSGKYCNLSASTVYAIAPISNTQEEDTPQTWLIRVNDSNPGRVRIIDPMNGRVRIFDPTNCLLYKNLLGQLPEALNLLDYRVTEFGKFYELVRTDGYNSLKVVFSSFLDEHDDDLTVMARNDDSMQPAMWRNVDQKWSDVDMGPLSDEYCEDFIYRNDRFYAFLSEGRTVTVDPKSLIVTQVAADLRFRRSFSMQYFVGSINDLFLVDWSLEAVHDDYYVEVFKLNEKERKWVQVVDGLDLVDRFLFVGEFGLAFSVSVMEFLGFKGAC